MFSYDSKIRVRYSETDKMGYAYNGNYISYYEVARVEALRSIGFSYAELEDQGILLPILENWSKFIAPAYYDEVLTIRVFVKKLPDVKFYFEYEFFNPKEKLIHLGKTTLVFVDKKTRKPTRPPEDLINKLKSFF
jgi:acyl-CoA thioester hydrolase